MRASTLLAGLLLSFAIGAAPAAAQLSFSGDGGDLVDHNGTSNGVAVFEITVSGTGSSVASLDAVTLTGFSHSYLGDLVIVLGAPDDTTFVVMTSPPVTQSSNFGGTYTFRVSQLLPTIDEITDGEGDDFVVPSGQYAASDFGFGDLGPRVDWTEMQGVPLDGNWVLQVHDFAQEDTGALDGWSFTVAVPEPAAPAMLAAGALLLMVRRRRCF